MKRAKKNPFSKPFKERAPGTRHRGLGKNNKIPISDRQRAIENGTIEDFREKERLYKKTSRQKLREKAILNNKLFKMAQAKLEEENLLIPKHVDQETMLQYLDVNCKMKVTPSTVNENPEMIERMYRQAVALKQSMKGQKKATFVKELTKQLRYMLNKVDDGRAFQVLENFFKSKIQELFSAADIVDLQQQHEGGAVKLINIKREAVFVPIQMIKNQVVRETIDAIVYEIFIVSKMSPSHNSRQRTPRTNHREFVVVAFNKINPHSSTIQVYVITDLPFA